MAWLVQSLAGVRPLIATLCLLPMTALACGTGSTCGSCDCSEESDGDCQDPASEAADDDEWRGPHGCLGASLSVVYDDDLSGTEIVTAIEVAIPELSCSDRSLPRAIDCVPIGTESNCGFASGAEAGEFEAAFRSVLADAAESFESYPYGVIDDCYCRVY